MPFACGRSKGKGLTNTTQFKARGAFTLKAFLYVMGAAALWALTADAQADDANLAGPVTFAEVAPILYENCAECHRPGDIAPMSLLSYDEVRPWAKSVKTEVAARRMPPWHADEGIGHFSNASNLSDAEIATVVKWVDAGAPLGDPSRVPAPPLHDAEWKAGPPDQVLTMPVEYEVAANSGDTYRCFVMDAMEEEVWLRGSEVRPSNRTINHHVVLFLDGGGRSSVRYDEATPEPGYSCYGSSGFFPTDILGVWAPGMEPELLPEGIARPLPKGSRIVMQVHYHSSDQAERDRSSVGLFFAKGPVKQRMRLGIAMDWNIDIPAGQTDYVSKGTWTMPQDAHVYGIFPHMHLIGKSSEVTAAYPQGKTEPLLRVSRYDFDWQRVYYPTEPLRFPAGTEVTIASQYDNSADNPNNPNSPPAQVTFGFASTDEMNVAFVYFTYDNEDLTKLPESERAKGSAILAAPPPPTVRLTDATVVPAG